MNPRPEYSIAALAIAGFTVVGGYRLIRWIADSPRSPDPWDQQTEDATNAEDAVPVCHHCLTPQDHNGWFCPDCGTPVGPYANYLPYVYVFSIGSALRACLTEKFRHAPLIMAGFAMVSLTICFIAPFANVATVLGYFFLMKLYEGSPRDKSEDLPS